MKKNYCNFGASHNFIDLKNDLSLLPFAFAYGGKDFSGFSTEFFTLKERKVEKTGEREDVTSLLGFDGVIEITVKLTHYFSHGVTEWTVWFENVSDGDSEIIENVRSVCPLMAASRS